LGLVSALQVLLPQACRFGSRSASSTTQIGSLGILHGAKADVTVATAWLRHKRQQSTLEPEYSPGNRGKPPCGYLQWGRGDAGVGRVQGNIMFTGLRPHSGVAPQPLSHLYILGSTDQCLLKSSLGL
jgi:hypothetical protein